MLGWINDCVEKLVIEKFSVEAWHEIKQKAKCDAKDGGFLKLDHYPDKSTIDLVVAASEVSGLSVDQVLEAFGAFFVPYIIKEGYENLLFCQGSTLKVKRSFFVFGSSLIAHHKPEYFSTQNPLFRIQSNFSKAVCSNINEIHMHLQTTFPKKMIMPEFWCEECQDGSLMLHYHSKRGSLLVPVASGIVTELARYRFGLDIVMDRMSTQSVDGAKFTR